MKKKISLLLCAMLLVFSFAGCGSERKDVEFDQAVLEQYAEGLIVSFAGMNEEIFAQYAEASELEVNMAMLQAGIPVEKDALVSMMNSWQAAIDECGAYEEHGAFTVEAGKSKVTLSAEANYEERNATIEFTFDEQLNMESMDVSAHYTISEILEKAGMNTVLGMGTVFAVLIFLAFIISLMKYIPPIIDKISRKREEVKEADAPKVKEIVETSESLPEDDLELVAAITAAIAMVEETSTDNFVVRSIKRRTSNKWNQ